MFSIERKHKGGTRMKKKYPWMKRLAASVLSLGLVVGSVGMGPQVAFAATFDGANGQTLQGLIDKAAVGETITLEKSVTESVTIKDGQKITLDLNGYTLTNSGAAHTITNHGKLTIVDGSDAKTGTVDNVDHQRAALQNEPGATAILSGGNFTRSQEKGAGSNDSGGNSYYNIVNHGTMEINEGVKVTQPGHFSSLLENGWYNGTKNPTSDLSNLTINGGFFSGGLNTIKNDDLGNLVIVDGTFENVTQHALMNWNVAEIQNGTFSSEKGVAVWCGYDNNIHMDNQTNMNQGKLTISGGEYTGAIKGNNDNVDIKISGGNFSVLPADKYLAKGYYPVENADGTYTAVEEQDVEFTLTPENLDLFVGGKASLTASTNIANAVFVYTSSNASVAKVDASGNISALKKGDATIYVSIEGYDAIAPLECAVSVTVAPPEQIILKSATMELTEGETGTVQIASPSNAEGATWTSDDETVATVSDTGVVKALKEGTAVITVELDGYEAATCTVSVIAKPVVVPTVSLNKTALTLEAGKSEKLTATTKPEGEKVTWSSDDTSVATVSSDGTVTAVGEGTATIEAMVEGGNTAVCEVTVTKKTEETPAETSITLFDKEIKLYSGETYQLKAKTVPEDAKITWKSSDEESAVVDENGLVTALTRPADVTVTATLGDGKSASCKIRVRRPVISSAELIMLVGGKNTLTVNPEPANMKWRSGNDKIVTVDNNGVVTAVSVGTTYVAAYIDELGTLRSCRVTVKEDDGNVEAGDSFMSTENLDAEAIAGNMKLPEGVSAEDVSYSIDEMIVDVAFNSIVADNSVAVTKEAEAGVKKELKDGQNAKLYLESELKDIQVNAVLEGEGENAKLVVTPVKLVYDVNAFQQTFDKDGNMVEKKLDNNKLSGRAFSIKLPIPTSADKKYAKVLHIGDNGTKDTYHCAIKNVDGEKYIEVSIRHFSTFEITFEDSIPSSGSSSSHSGSGSSGSYRHVATGKTGEWVQNATGWWFRYSDGTWPAAKWVELTWNNVSSWYYFGIDGYMVSGWLSDGGHWYYLHPQSDGTQGYMYTGWHEIGGKWYYFNTQAGGPLGSMAADTTTPDGYHVGKDGAWIQ